ncbi:hypothetical protein M0R45_020407 [Rubus argutus]|uniref:Uncharacterized protein n=1 Tax=Rubus argutus TaxID=59490 RepID=A0AAW1XA24_RUBAR
MAPQPQNLRSPKPPQASHGSPLPISSITAQSSTHDRASQSKNRSAITPEPVHDTSLNCRSQSHALPTCIDSSLPIRHLLTATPPTTSYSRRSPLPPLLASLRAPITTNHDHHIPTVSYDQIAAPHLSPSSALPSFNGPGPCLFWAPLSIHVGSSTSRHHHRPRRHNHCRAISEAPTPNPSSTVADLSLSMAAQL